MRKHPAELRKDPQFQAIAANIKCVHLELEQYMQSIDQMVTDDYRCYVVASGDVSFEFVGADDGDQQ